MVYFLLRVCRRLRVKLPASGVANYTQPCNFLINRRLLRGAKQCDMLTRMPKMTGRPAGNMTAVYADFLGSGLKWNRFGAGFERGIAKRQRFLLTRFLRSPVFGDNEGYGRVFDPAAAELALGGLPGLLNGI